jgi:hypothetical protein
MQKLSEKPKVAARQLVERKIAKMTIDALLKAGYSLGVNDSEETTIHHSRDARKVFEAMFTTDEDWLLVYVAGDDPKDKRPQYWVRFTYGNDGWDVINDYTTHLEPEIGEGTEVQNYIDRESARSI